MKLFSHPKFRILWLLLGGLTSAGGCGTETYNERLGHTEKLFEYINRLNENLGSLWVSPEVLGDVRIARVEIRMPRQLTEIPPPQPLRDENGEVLRDEEGHPVLSSDERQPHYSSVELPGLIGAWKGNVEAEVAGEFKQVPAYAYIMSNSYLWAKGEQEEAVDFLYEVAESVVDGLALTAIDENDWQQENYPPKSSTGEPTLVPTKSASVVVKTTDLTVDETRAEVSLHMFQNRDIRIAVLFVYPDTISGAEPFTDRIALALETIKISPDLPSGVAGSTGQPTDQSTGF